MPLIIESECFSINLERRNGIPELRILLVGRDLKARDRLWRATDNLPDRVVAGTGPDRLLPFLRQNQPVHLVVLDLDDGGEGLLSDLGSARAEGLLPKRVLGYFSHVNEELGKAATGAGVETYPRSRFWRELPALLSSSKDPAEGAL